jgi:Verrucomicrobium spinosum paralogous family TIGR02598
METTSTRSTERPQTTPSARRGFSLVEVTIAIGILGFCMIPIMGLIPVALKTAQQSMDRNTEARMTQTIRAQLLQSPFRTLGNGATFHFDVDGFPLENSGYYEVTASILPSTSLPGPQTNVYLRTAQLVIHNTARGQTRTNSIHLPDNGY